MTYDPSNPFGRILRGELEVERILETEHCLAVFEVAPKAPIHAVVIAKRAAASFEEFCASAPPEEVSGFFQGVRETAKRLGVDEGGYRLVCDQGEEAKPGVLHFHVHIVAGGPLRPLSWQAEEAELQPDLVLFLLPRAEPSTEDQVAGYAAATGVTLVTAQTHLTTPLPRILQRGPANTVRKLAAQLDDLQIPFDSIHAVDVEENRPWQVEWLELDDSGLWLVGDEGRAPLRVDKPALLIRGRVGQVVDLGAPRTSGFFRSRVRRRPGTTAISRPQKTDREGEFAHLYIQGSPRPYCFAERAIRDYVFLGEDMTASARANFERLLDILSDNPAVTVDDGMLRAPLLVRDLAAAMWTTPPKESGLAADAISRLIYHVHCTSPSA